MGIFIYVSVPHPCTACVNGNQKLGQLLSPPTPLFPHILHVFSRKLKKQMPVTKKQKWLVIQRAVPAAFPPLTLSHNAPTQMRLFSI